MKTIVSSVQKSTTMNIIMLFFITTLMVLVMASCSKNSGPMPEPPTPTSDTLVTLVSQKTFSVGTSPLAYACDSDGNVWITYPGGIEKITPSGVMTNYTGLGQFPLSITYDGDNMLVAEADKNVVIKITPSGVMTTYCPTGKNPVGIAFNKGNVYTANEADNTVLMVALDGTMTTYQTGKYPVGITCDGQNNVWAVNEGDNSVTKITPSGVITTYQVGNSPVGITCDGQNNVWTINFVDGSVTKITPSGVITTYQVGFAPGAIISDGKALFVLNGDGTIKVLSQSGETLLQIPALSNISLNGIAISKNGLQSTIWVGQNKKIYELIVKYSK
jgi:streptogramin lyase